MQVQGNQFLLNLLPSKNNGRNKNSSGENLPNYFKLRASTSINVSLNAIVLIQRQVIQVA